LKLVPGEDADLPDFGATASSSSCSKLNRATALANYHRLMVWVLIGGLVPMRSSSLFGSGTNTIIIRSSYVRANELTFGSAVPTGRKFLVQGLTYYGEAASNEPVSGLNANVGGYHVRDIELAAAFDVNAQKVGISSPSSSPSDGHRLWKRSGGVVVAKNADCGEIIMTDIYDTALQLTVEG
jgi:hypothetical protein